MFCVLFIYLFKYALIWALVQRNLLTENFQVRRGCIRWTREAVSCTTLKMNIFSKPHFEKIIFPFNVGFILCCTLSLKTNEKIRPSQNLQIGNSLSNPQRVNSKHDAYARNGFCGLCSLRLELSHLQVSIRWNGPSASSWWIIKRM